jgi:hypothetical protein
MSTLSVFLPFNLKTHLVRLGREAVVHLGLLMAEARLKLKDKFVPFAAVE